MRATCAAGHSKFLHAGLKAKGSPGKNIAAQVLPDLQRKGLCGKEAFLLKSGLVTLARQSNSLRGN
ncbi:MAG TPA: hypothetical protein VNW95_07585 [Mucilaginibacter sp.]|nr:hypothetical protein [Mucilaginibacter sp.]